HRRRRGRGRAGRCWRGCRRRPDLPVHAPPARADRVRTAEGRRRPGAWRAIHGAWAILPERSDMILAGAAAVNRPPVRTLAGAMVHGFPDIPEAELQERFIRASGPGGQNVNKVATAVELRFDVARSPSLPEAVRARLLARR